MMSRRIPSVASGLFLLLAACTPVTGPAPEFSLPTSPAADTTTSAQGSGDQSTTTGTGEGQGDVTSGYVPAEARAQAAAEAAVGGQYGTEEFGLTMRDLTSRAEEVETLISECMAEAGFEYVPVDFTTIRSAMTSDKSAPGLSGSEYLREYGHGITTQPDKPIVEIGLGEQNQRILEGLSEADQVAYRRTLWGQNNDATLAFGLESEDFSRTGGCTRGAIEQVFEPHELAATYFNPADALILQDPRAREALEEFAACMSEAGFPYGHPDDVDIDLQLRYDTLVQGRDHEELTADEMEQLLGLQDEERTVTAASDSCESRHLEPVLDRIEEEFFGRS
ncbi:MAG TPA: hypothetical protein VGB33_09180 [Acidimicrobiia bacterium]